MRWLFVRSFLTCAAMLFAILLVEPPKAAAIPAFARKYGLPCSTCHTAWPELNYFGMAFRDRGYQLGNERDSPIWQNPSYWPSSARITPNWHYETADHQLVDSTPGDGNSGLTETSVNQQGFDLSGMDLWLAGTLYKNISFSLLPATDSTGTFHFENAFIRFDNLLNTGWLNFQFGHFELDNLVSEKRFLFLSHNGGIYQNYHFGAPGGSNDFRLGDNQTGMEIQGHNANSYTRYTVALLSSKDGGVGFTDSVNAPNPNNLNTGSSYDWFFAFTKGFQTGKLGVQRFQPFLYYGHRPTIFNTSVGGIHIPGTGTGSEPFYRLGIQSDLFFGKFELLPFFQHSQDNVYLANSMASNTPLQAGMRNAVWNGGFVEAHYYVNPQLVFEYRPEMVRMSQQGSPFNDASTGNINANSFALRWYPIMFSRAGVALHAEYSNTESIGIAPLSGNGSGLGPATNTTPTSSNSLLFGWDFAF